VVSFGYYPGIVLWQKYKMIWNNDAVEKENDHPEVK
jgi:hypothetical protein